MTPRALPKNYPKFTARMERARLAVGLSRADVDAALDRPAGFCEQWETATLPIDPFTLREFARLTRVPLEWLLEGNGNPPRKHPPVATVQDAIAVATQTVGPKSSGVNKKNWSEAFSRALAIVFANALRPAFPGITPDAEGRAQEVPARTNRGFKKLDVGYSTPELGLGLGVSLKSINFRDDGSGRYTKNYTRNDNELRAEAMDYHSRQPFAVLVGVLMLPIDSCDDAGPRPEDESSFAAAVRYFRQRSGRLSPHFSPDLFEAFFIGLYDGSDPSGGSDFFFDVNDAPPRKGRPVRRPTRAAYLDLSLDEVIQRIRSKFDSVNSYSFDYARPAD